MVLYITKKQGKYQLTFIGDGILFAVFKRNIYFSQTSSSHDTFKTTSPCGWAQVDRLVMHAYYAICYLVNIVISFFKPDEEGVQNSGQHS